MTAVCLYFKIHQPYRLRKYFAKDIDVCHFYEDEIADSESINQLADMCCLPANEIMYKQIVQHENKFKISFSISGVMLELFQQYRPDVVRSFKKLAATGCVEFLAETYYHSLSSLYSATEFRLTISIIWRRIAGNRYITVILIHLLPHARCLVTIPTS